MITGFNTNVRHGGRVFHVQTEDSGRAHPHIISHVYHGGTILASEKCGYAELLDSENLTTTVRALMEAQHKSMLVRLQRGELDATIAERLEDPAEDTGSFAAAPAAEPAAASPPPGEGAPAATPAGGPAAGAAAQKSLDEVILEYLVERSRDRAREGPSRGARSKG
jgi:hypothetical protein